MKLLHTADIHLDTPFSMADPEQADRMRNELRAAFVSAGLDGVGMIDLTDKTDILLDWKNQITIALGNDANLTYEIQVAVASLPIILRERGATVRGELDIRMYSDPSITNPIISFKPETAGEEGG